MTQLIEQLMERYSPQNRAERTQALREILQELALVGLWRGKFFEHAAFYGGTALRILYGLDRFSEDLDFTMTTKGPFRWSQYATFLSEELQSYGFSVELNEKEKRHSTAIKSAFLKTNTFEALLKVGAQHSSLKGLHPEATLRIKVEIDTDPVPGLRYEQVHLLEPLPVPIRSVVKPDLFAGKMHAALFRAWKRRVKGRDWWDLVWFLRKKIPLNLSYLTRCMHEAGTLPLDQELAPDSVKGLFEDRLSHLDLESAKEDVRPFIKDATIVDEWTADYFLQWIDRLTFEG